MTPLLEDAAVSVPAIVTRPTISREEFILTIYLDTNILIDFVDGFENNGCKKLLDLLNELKKNYQNANIRFVTSEYAAWEAWGHFKVDLYIKNRICSAKPWGVNRAIKGAADFHNADDMEMVSIGAHLDAKADFSSFVDIINWSDADSSFSNFVEIIVKRSKLSYKDSIIFASAAVLARAGILVTNDHQFNLEGNRITELRTGFESIKKIRADAKIPKIIQADKICDLAPLKAYYAGWFNSEYSERAIGTVTHVYDGCGVVEVQCNGQNFLQIDDYVFFVKDSVNLSGLAPLSAFKIEVNNLKDPATNMACEKGSHITIKPPNPVYVTNMLGAKVFLAKDF